MDTLTAGNSFDGYSLIPTTNYDGQELNTLFWRPSLHRLPSEDSYFYNYDRNQSPLRREVSQTITYAAIETTFMPQQFSSNHLLFSSQFRYDTQTQTSAQQITIEDPIAERVPCDDIFSYSPSKTINLNQLFQNKQQTFSVMVNQNNEPQSNPMSPDYFLSSSLSYQAYSSGSEQQRFVRTQSDSLTHEFDEDLQRLLNGDNDRLETQMKENQFRTTQDSMFLSNNCSPSDVKFGLFQSSHVFEKQSSIFVENPRDHSSTDESLHSLSKNESCGSLHQIVKNEWILDSLSSSPSSKVTAGLKDVAYGNHNGDSEKPCLSKKHRKVITKCTHASESYYANGMCKNCYHSKGRTKLATTCGHSNRALYAKGVCKNCYLSIYHKNKRRITTQPGQEDQIDQDQLYNLSDERNYTEFLPLAPNMDSKMSMPIQQSDVQSLYN